MHDLKSRLLPPLIYTIPPNLPLTKGGFFVSLRLTSPAVRVLCKLPFFITSCHKFCANIKIERPKIFSWRPKDQRDQRDREMARTKRRNDRAKPRTLYVVILNEVKNLSGSTTVGPLETGRSFACAQDDIQSMLSLYSVILNEVKNLLVGNTLCALSLVGCEEMFRQAQHDIALL